MRAVLINGIASEYLSVDDRALHYGDGLFETIACTHGKIEFWTDHVARLTRGLDRLKINMVDPDAILNDIKSIINDPEKSYVIKLIVSRGGGERGYKSPGFQKPNRIVMVSELKSENEHGAKVRLCHHTISFNKSLAGLKHLNRLDNVLARSEWNDQYDEGMMSDSDGNIIEGTMSNVFAIKDNVIRTPDLTYCGIEGIIRNKVIEIAKRLNITTEITNISYGDLIKSDALFLTNSLIKIWPVSELDNTQYISNAITKRIVETLQELSERESKAIT